MTSVKADFDGLAASYDRARPRYPAGLFAYALELVKPSSPITVVDAGGGTGIALETLIPLLPADSEIHSVDLSTDMVGIGRSKFPDVRWTIGEAEAFLESFSGAHLIVAAQAFQWMDRPRFVQAAASALRPQGVCMVIQNNRDHAAGGFAAAYETLLERYSPGYHRDYRAIDVAAELREGFPIVHERRQHSHRTLPIDAFVEMSSSSTQVQRAVRSIGPIFLEHVRELCLLHQRAGSVVLPYLTEGYFGVARARNS